MKKIFYVFLIFQASIQVNSQGNCLLYPENSNERKACNLGYEVIKYRQGSKQSQILFDSIIKLNPKYDWAYMEKSVPYFKRGFIIEGLDILNKAIELNPVKHLCYRAYWYFQNRNYQMCIRDLERYYQMPKSYEVELTPGGDLDMRFLLGMSYAKIGEVNKGIEVIKNCIDSYAKNSDAGFVDFHILGMLYVKNKEYKKALEVFKKQMQITEDYADTYYYLGLVYEEINQLDKAKEIYKKGIEKFNYEYRIRNGYLCFKVYVTDIENQLNKITKL